ncbi:hypothetical protein LTR85_008585 [Meristemomyces frigidus]|nr:hypothetical protein LTR85_008585 [Meristemomyces frigidus]
MVAMALRLAVCALASLAVASPSVIGAEQQQPLGSVDGQHGTTKALISELKKAEIIPTVIDVFTPLLTVSIVWEKATADVGNTLDPAKLQEAPSVQLIDQSPDASSSTVQLTIALTDPDAPSRDEPEWSEICHWIATGVHRTDADDADELSSRLSKSKTKVKDIMPYKPPGPPPKTGKHRYVFVALAPKNGTTEKLSLSKPGDRQHWGYGEEGVGLRKWAGENGLEVVGANFIYAQNEKQ